MNNSSSSYDLNKVIERQLSFENISHYIEFGKLIYQQSNQYSILEICEILCLRYVLRKHHGDVQDSAIELRKSLNDLNKMISKYKINISDFEKPRFRNKKSKVGGAS